MRIGKARAMPAGIPMTSDLGAELGPFASPALMRLLWLASPALPIGAYAYSRGLEQAVTRGWVHDEASLERWLLGVLRRQLVTLDAPVMLRVQRAHSRADSAAVVFWNEFLLAHRETREFALEDAQLGGSLQRVLREAGGLHPHAFPERPAHATAFGIAAAEYGIPERGAVVAYLFAFVENQVTAALKCLTMGQTTGQRVLSGLVCALEGIAQEAADKTDGALGSFAPGLSLASALHETQYTRLFRS